MNERACLPLLAIALALGACSKQRPSSDAPPPSGSSAVTPADTAIEPWILTRLRRPGRALAEIDPTLPAALREAQSVRAARGYSVESPAMRLVVARFDDQAKAQAAEKAVVDALAEAEPPLHYGRSSITGAYLLVIGFPSHKPVSPEMESARTAYLSAFAGEE